MFTKWTITPGIVALLFLGLGAGVASAQSQERMIGRKGAAQLSFGASLFGTVADKVTPITNSRGQTTGFTTSREFAGDYFGQWDIGYFTTDKVVLKVGNTFFGAINQGNAKPDVGLSTGMAFYFNPRGIASPYVEGDYQTQLTNRSEGDPGNALGKFGLQSVVGTSTSIFFEGGYGFNLKEAKTGIMLFTVGLRVLF